MANWTLFKLEYDSYQTAIQRFKDTEALFLNAMFERAIEISKIIKSGTVKPESCNWPSSIPYSLAEFTLNDILEQKYPASDYYVNYDCPPNKISLTITAIFRSEQDTNYTYTFPILEEDYQDYLAELRVKMGESRKKILERDLGLKQKRIVELQEELERLKSIA